jgi:hypothetical protein
MCQFGDSSKILDIIQLDENQALTGLRSWYIINSFNDEEKKLKSLNRDYIWSTSTKGNPLRENSEGIYSYNNYYNNNYNNYNYNYYNYYYNNYNYNNYNYYYNNYNYNNYNNYNYYYIIGLISLFGRIFKYKEGYRSEFAKIQSIAIIDNPYWLNSKDEKKFNFINHFHKVCNEISNNYKIKLINYSELEKF